MIRAIIIEDEPLAADLLSSYAEKIEDLVIVEVFHNPLDAIPKLQEDLKINLVFLDIHMPELRGTDLAKILPKNKEFVFTTAYPEYAVEGFELKALDYLVKPISFIRFLKAVERYRSLDKSVGHSANDLQDFIFVKAEYKLIKLNTQDILFFQGNGDYCDVVCTDKKILTLEKLSSFQERLSPKQFLRVHKSYIVCTDKIDSIEKKKIRIGEQLIPIGSTYLDQIKHLTAR